MDAEKSKLRPPGYRPRLIEKRLDMMMRAFGCVEINGPKWCGKTWTAMTRSCSMVKLDEPAERQAAEMDPSLALMGAVPHLVDEWQEVPEVWDAARRYVDETGNQRGALLLTGSTALKNDQRERVRHSGTGRIGRITMRPMALCESGDSTASVSLADLFEGKQLKSDRRETKITEVAQWCCRGGWPANLELTDEIAAETAVQYLQSFLEVNVVNERLSPVTAQALLRALALNESQAVTFKTLGKDMAQGEIAPDEDTIASYLELFERARIIENLRGWEPPMRSKARVRVKPKRYFCDPSLAAALLGATPERLLGDMQTFGLFFENLVIRDLRIFLSTYSGLDNGVFYYRSDKGLEVDVIVEHAGKWAGIEIKLSDAKVDEGAKSLLALKRSVLRNPAANNAEPAFLAVVVGKGSFAYTREDGVLVIPMGCLGA